MSEHSPQKTGPNWGDLRQRLMSAFLLIPIVAAAIIYGQIAVAVLVAAAVALAYQEWSRMVGQGKMNRFTYLIMGLLAVGAVIYPIAGITASLLFFFAGAIVAALSVDWRQWRLPYYAAGAIFFGVSAICVLALRGDTVNGIWATVFLAVVIWLTDSGAFFVGRLLGGVKLSPEISPSKTWSGAIGGLCFGTIGGLIVWLMATDSPFWIGILIAAVLSVVAQLGDLVESALKRRFLIKDSGDIIPGHGGILDRIDSFTFGGILLFLIGVIHAASDQVAQGVLIW
ncbi:phosphatidate cytidylyltransferase [Maritalea myrionectae]|uniref:Phosphatidate cytidylyltransferase n=2 Tax=Maritalea myrionectae TaxID=454601 RepID=A0A2R4MFA5_9HYPH|nr:phosphatidate cytidylyltransferase [Maritalea myrionectae]AVX04584.1 phosphatidate cytidylyltransferase [Maritalea myrionectae]